MDAIEKELSARKEEIQKELQLLFKANMKITDWDIPEVDDTEVANRLVDIFQEALETIKEDIRNNKYQNY